jgi:hypothetical protein
METLLFAYPRLFQWWSYTVSHGQLLLRSTSSVERPTQVDVLFKDVGAVQLPTTIQDLQVLEADPMSAGRSVLGDMRGRRLFVVRGRDTEGCVLAGTVLHDEGHHAYYDPSPLLPTFPP